MAAELTLGARSHIGKQRLTNEDAFCVLVGPTAPNGTLACIAVADGMGGHRAGEVASSLAIKELARLLGGRPLWRNGQRPEAGPLFDDVQSVNREVHRASKASDLIGMGTTLTAVMIVGATLHVAHVGDSRAYLLRHGQLSRLTKDHSWAEEQVVAGLLTPEQAVGHPGRNVLTRALGVAPVVDVDTAQVTLEERDIVLVCSDGLYSQVKEDDIVRILGKEEPQEACERLVEQANLQGGRDNITTIVLRLDHIAMPPLSGSTHGNGSNGAEHTRSSTFWSKLGKAMRLIRN